MFNHSDFVPHWTQIVPFVWNDVIVQGSLSYQFSDLWRIPFFVAVLYHQLGNPNHSKIGLHAEYWDQSDIVCSLLFYSNQQGKECQTAYPDQVLVHLERLKYCMVGRVNNVFLICLEHINVTGCHWVWHVYLSSAEHSHDYFMHVLQYGICLWVLDTGCLTLFAICVT